MWSNVIVEGDSPQARCKHAVVLVKQDLYLYGGKSGSSYLKDFWKLELCATKWIRVKAKNSPPPLQEQTMVHHKDQIYMFGGEIGIGDHTPLWIYNLKNSEWRKWSGDSKIKSPHGSRGHVALVYSGYMLVHGGYRDLKGSLGDLWAFHFETESWHMFYSHQSPAWYQSVPSARHSHAGVIHAGSLYVYGGMSDLQEKGDCWKFDLASRNWIQVKCKPNPGPVVGPSLTKAFGSLFLYGGDRNGKPSDELWRFLIWTGNETWEKISFHGVKPVPTLYPAVAMLPAIVKVSSSNITGRKVKTDEDVSYWWDYDYTNGFTTTTTASQVSSMLKRMSSGHYQALSSGVEECGLDEEWTNGDPSDGDHDDLPLSPQQNPKRSETTNCFRSASVSSQRVHKSNSVRFSDFQPMPNSTSDYASMETLEEQRRNGFENPNYTGPPEMIEMENLSRNGCPCRAEIEVTTPNYLLIIGGQEKSTNSHILKKPISIWRLRVAKELLE